MTAESTRHEKSNCTALDVQLPRDDPGDVEHVFDNCACSLPLRAMTSMAWRDAVGRQLFGFQDLHPPENRVERRTQLVREGREEFILVPAGFVGCFQTSDLGLLPGGHVPADARQPRRRACSCSTRPLPSSHRMAPAWVTIRYSTS